MAENLPVTPRQINGGTPRWSLIRLGYSFLFTLISVAATVLLTLLAIPLALLLPQGVTICTLLTVLVAVSAGEILTQYQIDFSFPDTDNVFRQGISDHSKTSPANTDKVILGIMIAAGVTGLFTITLMIGAIVSLISPVGSLLIPVAILLYDKHLFQKYNSSLCFAGANIIKWVFRYRSNFSRDIKRIEVLHEFSLHLLSFSQGPRNVSNSI